MSYVGRDVPDPPCSVCGFYGCRCDDEGCDLWDTDDDSEPCMEADEESGEMCIREPGHAGKHQNRPCDGTCDTCECVEWE